MRVYLLTGASSVKDCFQNIQWGCMLPSDKKSEWRDFFKLNEKDWLFLAVFVSHSPRSARAMKDRVLTSGCGYTVF